MYTWLYQLGLAERAGIRAMPPPAPTDRISCTVKLPAELWQWALVEAVMFDCSVSVVVEEALQALRGLPENRDFLFVSGCADEGHARRDNAKFPRPKPAPPAANRSTWSRLLVSAAMKRA